MPIQRLLALVSGKVQEYVGKDVSAGAGDAGAIVALNTAGKLDTTMMPAGIGAPTAAVTASEALAAGAYVNLWSGGVRNADGSTTGKQADGYVLAAVASGATATVYFAGLNTSVTGQTVGPVYLGATAGAGATAGNTTAGQTYQQVGIATAATSVNFGPLTSIIRA